MSTASFPYATAPPRPAGGSRAAVARSPTVSPRALALGLLLVVLYAAFQHGAVGVTREARVQVLIAALAATAAALILWGAWPRPSASRPAWVGIGLLAGFAVWSGVSLSWSVAPDGTWAAVNRAVAYLLVLGVAVALGAALERPARFISRGLVAIGSIVALYALGQKLVPGLHIDGLLDLNLTGPLPRLQEPFGYWNALALFMVLAVPAAMAMAVDEAGSRLSRTASLGAAEVMLLVIGLTYSRGGLVALAVAAALLVAFGGARLRTLAWIALVSIGTLPVLLFGLLDHAMTATGSSLGSREVAGAEMTVVLIVCLLGLGYGAGWLIEREHRVHFSRARARAVARLLTAFAALLLLIGVLSLAVSSRGLTGSISHAWKAFTTTRDASPTDTTRLLSADSANRWVWWKQAAGAFSDRPIEGWGAGSFPVIQRIYRHNRIAVRQPHNMPLEFLSETGLVGAGLVLGAFAVLLLSAAARIGREPSRAGSVYAAALLGACGAYAVHSLYDWDWDIPAVTLPMLLCLGVLLGARREWVPSLTPRGGGVRLVAIAVTTGCLALCAISAALPSIASSELGSALESAAGGSPVGLAQAGSSAALASRLDPFSDEGLRIQATIALREGRPRRARDLLIEAVRRNPNDPLAWQSLAFAELGLGDVPAAGQAVTRMLSLDPRRRQAILLALTLQQRLALLAAPPSASGTVVPTP